jgi:DNA repair exonuclease SbcCD ATPase subunit
MRNLGLSAFLFLGIYMWSCTPNSADFSVEQLDSLSEQLASQNATIKSQLQLLDDIDQALGELDPNALHSVIDPEKLKRMDEEIFSKINQLKGKLEQDQKELDLLRKELAEANQSASYRKDLLSKLNTRMDELRAENEQLKEQVSSGVKNVEELTSLLEKQGIQIGKLRNQIQDLQEDVTDLTTQLNTVYYRVGSRKELKTAGIINRSGVAGALALAEVLPTDQFMEIDKMKNRVIDLAGFKKVTLIPTRNEETYELLKSDDGLIQGIKILDVNRFWSNTSYLVIVSKGEK